MARSPNSSGKKATNLTVNSALLSEAKELGINLSAVLECALAAEVKRLKAERWLRANHDAIATYNQTVAGRGVFSDGLRAF